MARVAALVPDLLFGSRLQGALTAAGHEITLLADMEQLSRLLDGEPVDVLVVDLTDATLDGAGALVGLRDGDRVGDARSLAFYAHVDLAARERAENAGFDLVVPRSRMAREGGELVSQLAARPG